MWKSGILCFVITSIMALAVHGPAVAGDVAKGEKVFKKCKACHSLEPGKKKVGPSLHGVFGRTAGTSEGFKYSALNSAAGDSGLVWNEDAMFAYLPDPNAFLKKFLTETGKAELATGRTKMTFKLKKEDQRKDVIAFLKENTQ